MKSRFEICGHIVRHLAWPRFSVRFIEREDGAWDGEGIQFDDDPPQDASILAKHMREAGDFFGKNLRRDWLQDAVIARAERLGLTSYEIAKRTGGAVSEDHVRAYITHAKSMGSHKLQHVLRVLNLKISEG